MHIGDCQVCQLGKFCGYYNLYRNETSNLDILDSTVKSRTNEVTLTHI